MVTQTRLVPLNIAYLTKVRAPQWREFSSNLSGGSMRSPPKGEPIIPQGTAVGAHLLITNLVIALTTEAPEAILPWLLLQRIGAFVSSRISFALQVEGPEPDRTRIGQNQTSTMVQYRYTVYFDDMAMVPWYYCSTPLVLGINFCPIIVPSCCQLCT